MKEDSVRNLVSAHTEFDPDSQVLAVGFHKQIITDDPEHDINLGGFQDKKLLIIFTIRKLFLQVVKMGFTFSLTVSLLDKMSTHTFGCQKPSNCQPNLRFMTTRNRILMNIPFLTPIQAVMFYNILLSHVIK